MGSHLKVVCGVWPWLGVCGLSHSTSLVLLPEIAEDWARRSPQLFAGYGSKAQTALLHWTFSSYRIVPMKCFKATFFDDCWCTYKLGYLHAVAVRVFSFFNLLCRHFTMGLSSPGTRRAVAEQVQMKESQPLPLAEPRQTPVRKQLCCNWTV